MKFKKILLFSLCFILLLITGCGKVPKLENGQELVVEMEGFKITVDELYNKMKDTYATTVLINIVDEKVLDKEYPTNADLIAEINNQIEYIKLQTGENFYLTIKNQWGLNNEQELFDFIKIMLKRNMAIKDYVKGTIKDKEIEKYYKDETVGDIKASHILIKPKVTNDMSEEDKEAKEQEALDFAKGLIKQLDEGADFAELAKKHSDDEGNASNGGDLGWFNKGKMDENFEKAAYELKKDTYTITPVKSAFGYHIILKTDEKEKAKLEDVKDNIIESLVNKKLNEDTTLNHIALEQLRKKYKLVIHDSNLNKHYNDYLNNLKKK